MSKLDISNVVRVTLLSALRGLADANTSNLALFTDEQPIRAGFGDSGTYKSAAAVAEDFGSGSDAAALAEAVFAQSPNILTGNGSLIVIPRDDVAEAAPAVVLSTGPVDLTTLTAEDYAIGVEVDGAALATVDIGAVDASSIEDAEDSLNAADITSAGLVFKLSGEVSAANIRLETISAGATSAIVVGTAATGTNIAGLLKIDGAEATGAASGTERVKDAILRTLGLGYFGIILNETPTDDAFLELARMVQTMDKLLFIGSNDPDTFAAAGDFLVAKDAGLTHTRCLYYSASAADALLFAAGYAGRALSINFEGSRTAHTMHLKEIVGLTADDLDQTALDAANRAGVDVYADFGVPKLFTSGANQFFDQVYTRLAFKLRLQVAGFNYLAQTGTKIPQTEEGLSGLKGAYRKVCERFVLNGTFAPGLWTDSTTFGDPETHKSNIAGFGFYVCAEPISQQGAAARAARIAPPIYIAAKDSGAIHSSDVVVFVEG